MAPLRKTLPPRQSKFNYQRLSAFMHILPSENIPFPLIQCLVYGSAFGSASISIVLQRLTFPQSDVYKDLPLVVLLILFSQRIIAWARTCTQVTLCNCHPFHLRKVSCSELDVNVVADNRPRDRSMPQYSYYSKTKPAICYPVKLPKKGSQGCGE